MMMPRLVNQFYECDNPACKLRFPGTDKLPRWHRCPLCRSSIHLVATSASSAEDDNLASFTPLQQVVVVLDNIRSAWNVGSIFRTADGTGIATLYLCGITPAPDNPRVAKTALGAETSVAWERQNNAVDLVSQLKARGCILWVLEDLPGAQPLYDLEMKDVNAPIALVCGNENSGIDPGIIEQADRVISIPMLGKKQSYNVAVAFGMAASFLLYRQSFSHGSRSMLPNT